MPKEIHKTFYACNICGEVYDSRQEAMECESAPILEDKYGDKYGLKKHKVGDHIKFEECRQVGDDDFIIVKASGEIINIGIINYSNYSKLHQRVYWTRNGYGVRYVDEDTYGWNLHTIELKSNILSQN